MNVFSKPSFRQKMSKYVMMIMALVFPVQSAFSQQTTQDGDSVVRGHTIERPPNVSVTIQANSDEEKSPVLACVMSCLVPGSGQYYNGEIAKGVIQQVLVAGGITLALAAAMSSSSIIYVENYSGNSEAGTLIWVGLGAAGASYIWSIIDAPISASRINREYTRPYDHLLEFSSETKIIGLDLATNGKTIGAKLSMHF